MKTLLIINVGQAPEQQLEKYGDFEFWAQRAISEVDINVTFLDGINNELPAYDTLLGVIIMGSLSMVTEKTDWMLRLSNNIIELTETKIPLLGICFGHQLIAQALGGIVSYNPKGLEIGTVELERLSDANSDPLFEQVPESFTAQTVHFQSVQQLPPNAVCLAKSELDNHHAFRAGTCTWGVQFHPEFTSDIMRDSVNGLKEAIADQYEHKLDQIAETEQAKQILVRFAQMCKSSIDHH
ncbi:glutamine amidotransferase [Vibrio ziniensis]|uniref:Glutamine amidotransferase n=1 Tax=Vibrio ziniensis TaxID=2711221 RepID=A0A6G7CN66_9VIBR|nr:glutamine amidotransferase [Vibrio ziniensis]QIH43514.1 glutamine amidotransferase [Vibrio ziniensis]